MESLDFITLFDDGTKVEPKTAEDKVVVWRLAVELVVFKDNNNEYNCNYYS